MVPRSVSRAVTVGRRRASRWLEMGTGARTRSIGLAVVATLALVVACIPQPADRQTLVPATTPPIPTDVAFPSATGPTPLPSFVRPTPTPLPSFRAYVVVAGDTLSSIARRFDTSATSIAYWNRTTYPSLDPESPAYRPDRIQIGWTLLVIPGVVIDGDDLPDSSSGPTATVTPTAAPTDDATPRPTASGSTAAVVVRHGPRSDRTVALTFDMGGRLDPALDILDWLITNDVPATIFTTGRTGTTTTTGKAALEQVAEHRDLFDLGNHSWSHPDFRDLDATAMRDQLTRTESAVVAAVNRSTKPWFRPPYGGLDDQVPAVVGAAGWHHIVLWDVDAIDWKPESDGGPTTQDLVDKVVDNAQNGSIVLMHLGGYHTLDALPGIVDGLRAKGLEPVTLREMFGAS